MKFFRNHPNPLGKQLSKSSELKTIKILNQMKKQIILALAFTATFLANSAFANTIENTYNLAGTTVSISATTDKAIIVNLGTVKGETVTIAIENAEGARLMTEKVKETAQFSKKYNVSKLDNGKYKMIVTKKTLRTVQPFDITDKGVLMAVTEKKEKFIPVVSFMDNKLKVNVLLGNYSNITVTMYDADSRKVINDKNYVVLDLHKTFNVSALAKGTYVVEVMAGDERFFQTIEK
jgi:hypothetical protein